MEEEDPNVLFNGVSFTVIPSEHPENREIEDIIGAIESNGGKYIPLREKDQQVEDISKLTHIISQHVNFPDYTKAIDAGVHVVKSSWVAQSIKKRRVAGARQHSPDPSQFFQDVILSCADLPPGDADAISAGVIAMGGQVSGPITKLVTHIATTSMDHDKCKIAVSKHLDCYCILPHWFDDCLRLGKKINERPYMFPDPEVLRRISSPVRSYPSPQLQGATTATPTGQLPRSPPPSPSKSRKSLNAFTSKKVLLSSDLSLGERLLKTLELLIRQAGGLVLSDVHDADIYIGQFRDGPRYVTASQEGKEVANLSWLYHVINQNTYTNPLHKLLHYPVPRDGIPGFENMKISVSNYSGDARIYLENLIKHSGAEYTKTMKQDNTHLITAHMASEKCEAAQEWNINIVNHLWLEESFAKCSVQTLSNPKYTHFPTRTNLGEIAGQTALDIKRLEFRYFPKPRSPQKNRSPQKPSPRKTLPQSSNLAVPPQHTPSVAREHTEPDPEEGAEAETSGNATPTPVTTKKPRGRPSKSLGTPRLADDEKENELPARLSTGRASKAKALDHLQKQAGDIALFQKEMKRKGGVTHGGRLSEPTAEEASPTARNTRKRPSDTYEATALGSDLSDGETQKQQSKPTKRAKQTESSSTLPPIQLRMMVTGDERWQGKMAKESADKAKLRMLGVLLVQDSKNVQILVAPRILRTRKFVTALACAPMVVGTDYLDTALNENRLIEEPELLQDPETEQQCGFKLADSLERAKVNKHKLFQGWSIFVTKDVTGGFDTYKDIITTNGGSANQYSGRVGTILPRRPLKGDDEGSSAAESDDNETEHDYVYLISGDTAAEKKLHKVFRDSAEKQGLRARVVGKDWILTAAMSQEITWKEEWAL